MTCLLHLQASLAIVFLGSALPVLAQEADPPDTAGGGGAAPTHDQAQADSPAQAPAPPTTPLSEPEETGRGAAVPAPEQTSPPAPAAPPPVAASKPHATAEVFVPPEGIGDLQLSLEDLLNLKVTVASKTEETTSQAPSMVTVFTREDIRRLGVRTVEQLLNFVPGFQANPDESDHYWRIDVRGRNTAAAESVLMLVDGQRVND